MSLKWIPEVWAKLAQNKPEDFLKELSTQRQPSASLFTKTYLICVIQGFRSLNKHQNTKYEAAFFLEMAKLLPHEDAQKLAPGELGSIRYLHTERTPIEYLLWSDALAKRLNPAEKFNFHNWLLQLRKTTYDPENQQERFSLEKAPDWAAAYTEIQRGVSSARLHNWLSIAPIAQSLGVVNAASSLHAHEKPIWLTQCLEAVLSRTAELHQTGSVYDIMSAISHAWKVPSPSLDAAVVTLICDQPKGMSLMGHAWFVGHYGCERHAPMLDWWSRQSPQGRGLILHHWLADESNWTSLSQEEPNDKKPGTALDMCTLDAVDLPTELARDIVLVAPFEKEAVRTFLARIIPAIHAAELTVEPKEFKSYLLSAWDMLHEKAPVLSVDGLLDLQP